MKNIRALICFALLAATLTLTAQESFEFSDLDGKTQKPLDLGPKKAAVLIFISRDCPTSNAFVPEVNRLASLYEKSFAFWLVQADSDITAEEARKHVEILRIKPPVMLDPEQRLAKVTNAKVTPEAVVIGPGRKILYQGRINDLYLSLTKRQPQPTTHDLQVVLDTLLAEKSVTITNTKAIGCSIRLN